MDQDTVQHIADHLSDTPSQTWLLIGWCGALLLGAALWSLGGRLARPSCALSGLVIGVSGGYTAAQLLLNPDWTMILVVGGALLGGLVAWLLFRVWMAISLAGLLGLVFPLLALAWDGRTVAEVAGPVQAPVGVDVAALRPSLDLADMKERARAIGRTYVQQLVDLSRTVWGDLSTTDRTTVITGAGASAVVGFLLGLIVPYLAAAVEASIVGASLMLVSAVNLLNGYAPEQAGWLIASPRRWFLILGLITMVGVVLQWTVLRKKADSK